MQLYAVNFIPLLGSLYMFRVFYTPIIRSSCICWLFHRIYYDAWNHKHKILYLMSYKITLY